MIESSTSIIINYIIINNIIEEDMLQLDLYLYRSKANLCQLKNSPFTHVLPNLQ